MPNTMPPAFRQITIEIEVNDELLAALEKSRGVAGLSNAERFEIAVVTLMAARAICLDKRAQLIQERRS